MAYQSPQIVRAAALTPAGSADLRTANALLIEKWQLFYPAGLWRMADYTPTASVYAGEAPLSGTLPGQRVDELYGEAVPLTVSGQYFQPHAPGATTDAPSERRRYKAGITVNVGFRREPVEDPLELAGAIMSRKFTVTMPVALLDLLSITANVGDAIVLAGQQMEVSESIVPEGGYWKFTNIPMYVVCKCGTTDPSI